MTSHEARAYIGAQITEHFGEPYYVCPNTWKTWCSPASAQTFRYLRHRVYTQATLHAKPVLEFEQRQIDRLVEYLKTGLHVTPAGDLRLNRKAAR